MITDIRELTHAKNLFYPNFVFDTLIQQKMKGGEYCKLITTFQQKNSKKYYKAF